MRPCLRVIPATLVILGWAFVAHAGQGAPPRSAPANTPTAAPAAPTNDDCLGCHSDAGLKRANNSPVSVDPKVFAASIHGPLSCTDCHADLATAELPHNDKLAKASCVTCHDEPQAKYGKSVHAKARDAGQPLAASCSNCHGTHDIKPASDPTSRTSKMNLPKTCASCHGNADVIAKGGIQIGNVASLYEDSIHGKALEKSGLVVAPSCVDCHGSHEILRKTDASSPVNAAKVPATCGRCHEGIRHQYDAGIHAAALKSGKADAPQCASCHTAHTIKRTDNERWRLSVTNECGTCHAQVVDSFRRTFHGKVTQLGFGSIAACADCHGAHEVLPASNAASGIAKGNLVATCGKCHEGANESFVKYDPHPDPRNYARSPVLWWANRLYTVLIAGCFGFFALHSGLWFLRSKREQREHHAAGRHAD